MQINSIHVNLVLVEADPKPVLTDLKPHRADLHYGKLSLSHFHLFFKSFTCDQNQ